MKIDNQTTWDTHELKKVFYSIGKHDGFIPREVKVVYSKKRYDGDNHISGCAYLNRSWVKMKLPNGVDIIERDMMQRLAQVFSHEISHCLGLQHREMIESWKIDAEYIKSLKITRSEKKQKSEKRKKLKNLHYKGHIAKIYRYPWKVTHDDQYGNHSNGFWYSFIIYNKITKQRIYRTQRKRFFESIKETHDAVKKIINKKINS